MKGVVYKFINIINGRYYLGSTTNFPRRRYQHVFHLRRGDHVNCKLQEEWDKFGESCFTFEVLCRVETGLREAEQVHLDQLDYRICYNMSNLAIGGDFIHTMPEERKRAIYKKMAASKKAARVKPPNRRRVSINGRLFDSMHEASKTLEIPVVTIRYRCLSRNVKFRAWTMLGSEKSDSELYRQGECRGLAIACEGKEFPSYAAAARYFSLSITAIQNRVSSPNFPDYFKKQARTTISKESTSQAIGGGKSSSPPRAKI